MTETTKSIPVRVIKFPTTGASQGHGALVGVALLVGLVFLILFTVRCSTLKEDIPDKAAGRWHGIGFGYYKRHCL